MSWNLMASPFMDAPRPTRRRSLKQHVYDAQDRVMKSGKIVNPQFSALEEALSHWRRQT